MALDETGVLFLDHLGFAAMTEDNPETPFRFPAFPSQDWHLTQGDAVTLSIRNPIAYRVLTFHRVLEGAIHEAARQGAFKAMLFSDSAYVVIRSPESLATFAAGLMREFVNHWIPVRMGLAVGTFHACRFRADTTEDVGIYTSQFFGTGVVRAYKAERSGKGLRIFVDSTIPATTVPAQPYHKLARIISRHDHTTAVPHEVEYLNRPTGKPWDAGGQTPVIEERDQTLRARIIEMQAQAPKDEAIQRQYSETLIALDAMRVATSRPPFAPMPVADQ